MKNNLSDLAYSQIKEMITHGEIPIGQVVSVAHFVRLLNIGRTPITNACQKLAAEEYIRIIPKQGIVVVPISLIDMRDVYETRQVVEIFTAEKAFPHIEPSDILRLEDSVGRQIECRKHGATYAFLEEYRFFHQIIIKKHRNNILADMYDNALGRSMPLDAKIFSNPKHMQEAIDNHCRQIDCLKAQDKQGFVNAVIDGQVGLDRFLKSYLNEGLNIANTESWKTPWRG